MSSQSPSLKIAVASWLYGDKTIGRLLCYYLKERGIRLVVLAGNTVSPSLVEWLIDKCGATVLGVTGNLDDSSLASVLASKGSLLETKPHLIDNLRFIGLGLTGSQMEYSCRSNVEATVFVSFLNGRLHKCCSGLSTGIVDEVLEKTEANLVITGACPHPCVNGKVVSPGYAYLGWVGVIEYFTGRFNIVFENLRMKM
ncbi:hypothetical protein IMZ38_04005 [Thermosphaera chiliense]|uniref:Phosphoesterase n=1 Tax=Thermosphaera chiliense TaxID=3402707 RepID=A0A7M1USY9_9CREN|nr:hypothetical protein [Thermosphaera aggregans]QOR93824.1 hypothetical protein IMZ38_04005 [Thermosphaera aggregans]